MPHHQHLLQGQKDRKQPVLRQSSCCLLQATTSELQLCHSEAHIFQASLSASCLSVIALMIHALQGGLSLIHSILLACPQVEHGYQADVLQSPDADNYFNEHTASAARLSAGNVLQV